MKKIWSGTETELSGPGPTAELLGEKNKEEKQRVHTFYDF